MYRYRYATSFGQRTLTFGRSKSVYGTLNEKGDIFSLHDMKKSKLYTFCVKYNAPCIYMEVRKERFGLTKSI